MKRKVNDWLLRLISIDSCGNRVISHVCLYDMTRVQVMELVEKYTKDYVVVRLFKLEGVF